MPIIIMILYEFILFCIMITDETIKRHRLQLQQKIEPLVTEIYETHKLRNAKDIEKFYQKILAVITLLSGLGSPTIPSVLKYLPF